MRTDYVVTIEQVSKELTHKERVQMIDTTSAVRLDKATQECPVLIDVDYYATLSIHNEKSSDKDYQNYLVVDKSGVRYVTGSTSFWNTFVNIMSEMEGSDEAFQIRVYRAESKNYAGKSFITCEIV